MEKEVSCYSSSLIINYAKEKGVSDDQLFAGIEGYKEVLNNPSKWTGVKLWSKFAANVEISFGNEPKILEKIGEKITTHQVSFFPLLFFKISPISYIIKNLPKHMQNNVNKVLKTYAKLNKNGDLDIFLEPKSFQLYSTQICDFNRGCSFATLQLKGFKNLELKELSCAARDKTAKACHYKLNWTPRPNIIQKAKEFFNLRFRDQSAIIQHMEENHNRLQEQYNETTRLFEKLKKSESKFRSIFENIQDVYYELTPDGTIIELSPSVSSISQYTREELLGTHIKDLWVDDPPVPEVLKRIESAGRVSDIEVQLKDKDGSVKHCSFTARFISDGQEKKITGVLRDISERKKAEAERLKLQEQLRQSEKLQSIGQLAGGIAHDFKNQLFGIAGNAKIIKKAARDNKRISTGAESILKAAQRSSDLTRQLLAFARKGKFQTVGIDINEMVKEVVDLLKRTIDRKINISAELNAVNSRTAGDPGQLENVFLNLAFNARDAMPGGGDLCFITKNVTLDEEYCKLNEYGISPGDYIQITVKDTGRGINKEIIKNVFEPFFTTKEFGSGLGLSAVYGTIKDHKGEIHITSAQITGTTVTINLPVSAKPVEKVEKGDDIQKVEDRKSIVLIEDEEIVRKSATDALEELGLNVSAFPDGTSAIARYKTTHRHIDLIILDMILPDLSPQEVFAQLKAINPKANIVLWSAYTLPETVQALKDKGALDFIDKGSDIGEFTGRIVSILNNT
jgi:PAS domain S-box-containing protein